MKLDMHCHTKEGSIDAKVNLEQYINKLIKQGFDGMLITDHNSYKGYQKWEELKDKITASKPFTVLKGIEYDTLDAGHFIAILPDEVTCRLVELRGLTVAEFEKIVHQLGGILGPAHPYGTGYYSLMHTSTGKHTKNIMSRFDFVETFNSCIKPQANKKAAQLAKKWQLPQFAGSDAHKNHAIGTAFTEFQQKICCNNDLIDYIKNAKEHPQVNDRILTCVYHNTNIIIEKLGIIGYFLYNKTAAALRFPARRRAKRHYHKLNV